MMVNDNNGQVSIGDLIRMIREGESETLEFKKTVTAELGKDIVAFANTSGGTILVGVSNTGNIVGAPKDAEQRISDILLNIVPPLKVSIRSLKVENKKVVIINVPQSPRIHTFRNIAYIRVGRNVRPLDIYELLSKASESVLFFSDKAPTDAPASELSEKIFRWYLERRKEVRGLS